MELFQNFGLGGDRLCLSGSTEFTGLFKTKRFLEQAYA
jgi:hypothetical protein